MFRKPGTAFLMIVALCLALMTLQSRTGPLRPLWFVSSFVDRANASIVYVKDGLNVFARVATLNEEELSKLKIENALLRAGHSDKERLDKENRRLRRALEFKSVTPNTVAVARIISRGGDKLSSILVIDKGSLHGVRKDMTAVVPEGLVGKVLSADESFSRILLIDDSQFSAAVRFSDTRQEAVYSGTGKGKGTLKYVNTDIDIYPETALLTSGLDAMFPPDIPVGYVGTVSTDTRDIFHNITTESAVRLKTVEEVTIISR